MILKLSEHTVGMQPLGHNTMVDGSRSSRAHHIIKLMAYLDHWRHWRQQLATVANSEKRGPLQILRLMKSIAFLITAAWR
jgi:hypothetical protein